MTEIARVKKLLTPPARAIRAKPEHPRLPGSALLGHFKEPTERVTSRRPLQVRVERSAVLAEAPRLFRRTAKDRIPLAFFLSAKEEVAGVLDFLAGRPGASAGTVEGVAFYATVSLAFKMLKPRILAERRSIVFGEPATAEVGELNLPSPRQRELRLAGRLGYIYALTRAKTDEEKEAVLAKAGTYQIVAAPYEDVTAFLRALPKEAATLAVLGKVEGNSFSGVSLTVTP